MLNVFKQMLKREDIKRNLFGRTKEEQNMGKLVIKDGKLVEPTKEQQILNTPQPIPQDVLEQMRQETIQNRQQMQQERIQPQEIEEEMLSEDIQEEMLSNEEEIQQMTGRQQYEQEQAEMQAQTQPQDFTVIVNMIMLGGLPIRINVPGQYIEDFIMKLNNAIDRQLHFNVGTQVLITRNILYYSLE